VDEISIARTLLNERRYEEAATVLEGMIERQPEDHYARLLLSSALVGTVGIDLVQGFDALSGRLFDQPLSARIETAGSMQLTDDPAVDSAAERDADAKKAERELLKSIQTIHESFDILVNLPSVRRDDRPKLFRAMALVRAIPEGSREFVSSRIYLAILDVIQFMDYFREALGSGVSSYEFMGVLDFYCNIHIDILLKNMANMTYFLSDSLIALSDAQRTSNSQVLKNLEFVEPYFRALSQWYNENRGSIQLVDSAHYLSKFAACESDAPLSRSFRR
jgi:hypothetical protein